MKIPAPDLLYCDEHLVVVNKPSGLLTIPDRSGAAPSVVDWLRAEGLTPFVVHRLDRETSGAVCFALHAEAHRHLSMQFERRTVHKLYHCVVHGVLAQPEGRIEAPIAPHPSGTKMMIHPSGKASLTWYRQLERFRQFTLVEADIRTGRMHQVRVHLSYIGNPLVGDALYGPTGRRVGFFVSDIKPRYHLGKWETEELPLIRRTALHAHALHLEHPATGEPLHWVAPAPKDLQAVLAQLRKWGTF